MDLSKKQPEKLTDKIIDNSFDALDYIVSKEPNPTKFISKNNMLIVKINFKLLNNTYISIPFIVDTNDEGDVNRPISFCLMGATVLHSHLKIDRDDKYIKLNDYKYSYELNNGNTNYIKLKCLNNILGQFTVI